MTLGKFTRTWIAEKALDELEAAISDAKFHQGALIVAQSRHYSDDQRREIHAKFGPQLDRAITTAERRVGLLVELNLAKFDAQMWLDRIAELRDTPAKGAG